MQLSSNAGMEKASHSAAEQGWGLGFRAFHVFSTGLGSKCLFQSRPEQISPAWSLRLESALWPATRGGTRHRGNIPSFSQSSRNAWGRYKTKHRVSSWQLRFQRNCHQETDCSEELKSNKQDMYLTSCLRLDLIYLSHFAVHLKQTQPTLILKKAELHHYPQEQFIEQYSRPENISTLLTSLRLSYSDLLLFL